MIRINLIADVVEKDGLRRLAFSNVEYYKDQVNRLDPRKKVSVTIENVQSHRSNQQNKYWHKVCFPVIAELTGYTNEEAKELCKKMFIAPKILTVKGKEYEVPRGSSELDKSEGVLFTRDMMQLAIELGGIILSPQEAGYATEEKPMVPYDVPKYDESYKAPLL